MLRSRTGYALIAATVGMGVPNSLALVNAALRQSGRARGIGIWAGLETQTPGPRTAG